MPESTLAPVQATDVASGAQLSERLTKRRSPGFGCATLRNGSRQSVLEAVMVKGERKTAKPNLPITAAAPLALPGTFFLRTKLLAPRAAPELLYRERLIERLRANLSLPVTLVAANAGSGKTTLVADFLRKQEQPYVWYQLDHTDSDPAVFLGYLAQ